MVEVDLTVQARGQRLFVFQRKTATAAVSQRIRWHHVHVQFAAIILFQIAELVV